MNKLIIYDSQFGNTEKIARAIAESISAKALKIGELGTVDIKGLDVLVVGSPTQGGRPTASLQQFLENSSAGELQNVQVAAFDTRFSESDSPFPLNLIIKTFGFAAPKIAKIIERAGGKPIANPEGFIVKGKDGPLVSGEIERAKKWIRL
jgi:flavodoxin